MTTSKKRSRAEVPLLAAETAPKLSTKKYWAPTILICNAALALCVGIYASILRQAAESYSSTNSLSWFTISNSGWIGIYSVCLTFSLCTMFLSMETIFTWSCFASVLFRVYCLSSIVSIHHSNTYVFKIDGFYQDCFYLSVFEVMFAFFSFFIVDKNTYVKNLEE